MGYFSSGTEGMDYQARYCERCVNFRDLDDGRGDGCAVWDAHMLYNYDQHDEAYLQFKGCLSILIPRDGIRNGECAMFLERVSDA